MAYYFLCSFWFENIVSSTKEKPRLIELLFRKGFWHCSQNIEREEKSLVICLLNSFLSHYWRWHQIYNKVFIFYDNCCNHTKYVSCNGLRFVSILQNKIKFYCTVTILCLSWNKLSFYLVSKLSQTETIHLKHLIQNLVIFILSVIIFLRTVQ